MSCQSKFNFDVIREKKFGNRIVKIYADRSRDVNQIFAHTVCEYGNKEALVDGDVRWTYNEFATFVNNMAYGLAEECKIAKGDRVALILDNKKEFCVALMAAFQIGGVAVPLNTRSLENEQKFMLQDSGAKVLVVDEENINIIQNIRGELKELEYVIVVGSPKETGWIAYDSFVSQPAPWKVLVDVASEDIAMIMYTSGTTGNPKGAMIAHLNFCVNLLNIHKAIGTRSDDRTVIAVPLFHITGCFFQFLHMILVGGTTVLMKRYKTSILLEMFVKEKISFFIGVPTVWVFLLGNEQFSKLDLSHLRLAVYGGSIMPEDAIKRLQETLPHIELYNTYGATEVCGSTSALPSNMAISHRTSVGYPFPTTEWKIMDDSNNELKTGEIGEIWIKGATVVKGYWNNPKNTASEFTDGYWHSGDIGCIDEEGLLYIKDRKKDLINRGGEKIFSAELENLIFGHPKVKEVAAVGVPDDVFGEQIKVVVVPEEGVEIQPEEIQEFVRKNLADFKVPKYVSFVEELPKNASGKVQKAKLIDL